MHYNFALFQLLSIGVFIVTNTFQHLFTCTGGGSGHEPAHAGFVGDGMLTAATAGMFLPHHLLLQFLLYLPPDELEFYSSDFLSFLSFDTAYEL